MALRALLIFCLIAGAACSLTPAAKRLEDRLGMGRCAVVTLVYSDDDFVTGATTLAYSLRDVHTRMVMVAMVTDAVSSASRHILASAGWYLHEAHAVANPNPEYFKRLEYIFTKLQIYTLTDFERVVYLDADTLVNENVDELCSCNAYHCAVVRNTFFNSGVIVAIPSPPIYADMMEKYTTTHSYTGGDQGFLNNYFWNPEECPFFDPRYKLESPLATDVSHLRCHRLPGYYNGDVGVYVARGDKWQFDAEEARQQPKITHYTLSVFKPWAWPSYVVIKDSWTWFRVYEEHVPRNAYATIMLVVGICAVLILALYALPRFNLHRVRVLFSIFLANRIGRAFFGQFQHLCVLSAAFYYSQLAFINPAFSVALFFTTYCVLFEIFCVAMWEKYWEAVVGTRLTFDHLSLNVLKTVTYLSLGALLLLIWSDALLIYGRVAAIAAWLFCVPGVAHTVFYQIPPISSLPK